MVTRLIQTSLLACACTLTVDGLAQVQTAAVPESTATAAQEGALLGQAKKLRTEGLAHYAAGDVDAAYAAFIAAWRIKRHYRVAGPLGAVELELKRYRDAAEHLQYYLTHAPPKEERAETNKAKALLAQARTHTVELTVSVKPTKAVVKINGEVVNARHAAFYEPGTFAIEASCDGYLDNVQQRSFDAGSSQHLTITLVTAPKPALTSQADGPDGRLVAGIAVGIGAVIGLGVGVGESVAAAGYASDVKRLDVGNDGACFNAGLPGCDNLRGAATSHDSAVDIATGGYIVGGVLAGVSVGLLAWWATAPDDGDVKESNQSAVGMNIFLAPSIGPCSAGLNVEGIW